MTNTKWMWKTSSSWTEPFWNTQNAHARAYTSHTHTHTHTLNTSQLPQFTVCWEPHPSISGVRTFHLISDKSPSTPSQNSQATTLPVPIYSSKFFNRKCHVYCCIYIFLNMCFFNMYKTCANLFIEPYLFLKYVSGKVFECCDPCPLPHFSH